MPATMPELRKQTRYKIKDKVIALSFEGACRLTDISAGGAAIKCILDTSDFATPLVTRHYDAGGQLLRHDPSKAGLGKSHGLFPFLDDLHQVRWRRV